MNLDDGHDAGQVKADLLTVQLCGEAPLAALSWDTFLSSMLLVSSCCCRMRNWSSSAIVSASCCSTAWERAWQGQQYNFKLKSHSKLVRSKYSCTP